MFTGIVTDIGEVIAVEGRGDLRLRIATAYDTASLELGASIACSGICLTVVDKGGDWFAVDASAATLGCTNLGTWRPGRRINLERALRVGDELGGHLVSGHVDGVARIEGREPAGDSLRYTFSTPPELARFIAAKGAVALDGVSLTVNEVDCNRFTVNIIPHTRKMTTFGDAGPGDQVNLEVDVLARYIARLTQAEAAQ